MPKAESENVEHVPGQSNKPMSLPAHALTIEAVRDELEADLEDGLTEAECQRRLEEYGRNELDDGPGVQPVKILIHQIANAMILVSNQDRGVYLGVQAR
jgi:Na+-exporting ATPase